MKASSLSDRIKAEILNRFRYCATTGCLIHKETGKQYIVPDRCGYVRVKILGEKHMAHRIIWFLVTGKEALLVIDHIDGVKTNNRIENLRQVTSSENGRHRVNLNVNNSSGYRGVSFSNRAQRWKATLHRKHIGWFSTKEQAIAAVVKAGGHSVIPTN